MHKILAALFLALFAFSLHGVQVSSAHELIPRQIQDYLERNPSASLDDVRFFIQSQDDDELKNKFNNNESISNILTRKTGFLDTFRDFVVAGIKHILEGPDHVLFVISILLVFVSLRDIFKMTGMFTLAHSITLILAGSGLLVLSSKIVEPMIALSIAYVAITSVFFKRYDVFSSQRNKYFAIFGFGLFHGLGFAGLLQDIHIPKDYFITSLISFNFGIEIGQLIVIAFALPLILSINKIKHNQAIIKLLAIVIAMLGLFWAVQRIVL